MNKNTIKHSKTTKKQLITIQKDINHVTIQGIYKTDTSNQLSHTIPYFSATAAAETSSSTGLHLRLLLL
jgi:hypothetical protein